MYIYWLSLALVIDFIRLSAKPVFAYCTRMFEKIHFSLKHVLVQRYWNAKFMFWFSSVFDNLITGQAFAEIGFSLAALCVAPFDSENEFSFDNVVIESFGSSVKRIITKAPRAHLEAIGTWFRIFKVRMVWVPFIFSVADFMKRENLGVLRIKKPIEIFVVF